MSILPLNATQALRAYAEPPLSKSAPSNREIGLQDERKAPTTSQGVWGPSEIVKPVELPAGTITTGKMDSLLTDGFKEEYGPEPTSKSSNVTNTGLTNASKGSPLSLADVAKVCASAATTQSDVSLIDSFFRGSAKGT